VAISGARAIVGAYCDDDKGSGSGSAYIYESDNGAFVAKITAPDGADWDLFGQSVAISGARAIVSAHADDDKGSSSGSAYVAIVD